MPYLANFSRNFYDKFGHDVVAELIAWLNQVYDEKREMDVLHCEAQEILRELREIRSYLIAQQSR